MAFSIASLAPLSFVGGPPPPPPPPPPLHLAQPMRLELEVKSVGRVAYENAWALFEQVFKDINPAKEVPARMPYASPSLLTASDTDAGAASPVVMPPSAEGGGGAAGGGGMKKSCSFKGHVKVASYDSHLSPTESLTSREEKDAETVWSSKGKANFAAEGKELATPREE